MTFKLFFPGFKIYPEMKKTVARLLGLPKICRSNFPQFKPQKGKLLFISV